MSFSAHYILVSWSTRCSSQFYTPPEVPLIQNRFFGWLSTGWIVDAKSIPHFSEGLDCLTLCGLNIVVID